MKAIDFDEANRTLVAEGCDDLRVHVGDDGRVVSAWQLEPGELARLVALDAAGAGAVICLSVWTGMKNWCNTCASPSEASGRCVVCGEDLVQVPIGTQPPVAIYPIIHYPEVCGFDGVGTCPTCGEELGAIE